MSVCAKGGKIYHLIVVPSLWQGMTGDDWLNNGKTRDQFCRYLENALGREVDDHCERVNRLSGKYNLRYSKKITLGEPSKVLIDFSQKKPIDLIIIGSPRPKGIKGLRSRMFTKDLLHSLQIPLLIVPYPLQAHDARAD